MAWVCICLLSCILLCTENKTDDPNACFVCVWGRMIQMRAFYVCVRESVRVSVCVRVSEKEK